MFLLHRPSDNEIRHFLATQRDLPFSYTEVGASRDASSPAGFPVNHHRARLGTGKKTFDAAVAAMRSWEMYSLNWTKLCWPETPIREGEVVAVLAKHFGVWSLNACRIIYTLEEESRLPRYGFAFGTLPGHVEQGEERFTVEWESDTEAVWYELFAFARPKPLVAKIGYPFVGLIQRRFAADSSQAMKQAVNRQRADLSGHA